MSHGIKPAITGVLSLIVTLGVLRLLSAWWPGLGSIAGYAVLALLVAWYGFFGSTRRWLKAFENAAAAIQAHNFTEAEVHAREALAQAERGHFKKAELREGALVYLAVALRAQRRNEEMIEPLQQALAAIPEKAALRRAFVGMELANALIAGRRFDEAERVATMANQLGEELGQSALRAGATNALADLAHDRGRLAEAAAHYRRVIELYRESGTPEMLKELPMIRINLGNTYVVAARTDRAIVEYEAALAALEQGEPGGHSSSLPLLNLSAALLREDRFAEALDSARRGLAIRSRYVPEDDQSLAGLWINLAIGEAQTGNASEARAALDRARRWEAVLAEDDAGALLTAEGHVLHSVGDAAGAERAFRAVLDKRTARHGPDHPIRIELLTDLAHFYQREQRDAEALACQTEANRLLALVGDV